MEEQNRPVPRNFFEDWKDREALAERLIPLIGKLYRKKISLPTCMETAWLKISY